MNFRTRKQQEKYVKKFWDNMQWNNLTEEQIIEEIDMYVQNGFDVNVRDSRGVTPLINAIRCYRKDVAKRLIELNARVNMRATDESGTSTLIVASARGMLEIAQILIEKRANVNAVNKKGVTSLMAAADDGHADVVKFLLDHGAQIDKGKGGRETLRLWALGSGCSTTVNLIEMAIKKEQAKIETIERIEKRKQIKIHQDEIKRHQEALKKIHSDLLHTTPERHELAERLNRMRKEFGCKAKAYAKDSKIIQLLREKVYGR